MASGVIPYDQFLYVGTVSDFNIAYRSGVYQYHPSSTNGPNNTAYGILIVYNNGRNSESNSTWTMQVAMETSNGMIWQRTKTNETAWKSWRPIIQRWELIKEFTTISSGTNSCDIDVSKYCAVNAIGKFSAGQCVQVCLPTIHGQSERAEAGFYYTSTACGGGGVTFVGSADRLDLFQPYYAGSPTTYTELRVYGFIAL